VQWASGAWQKGDWESGRHKRQVGKWQAQEAIGQGKRQMDGKQQMAGQQGEQQVQKAHGQFASQQVIKWANRQVGK